MLTLSSEVLNLLKLVFLICKVEIKIILPSQNHWEVLMSAEHGACLLISAPCRTAMTLLDPWGQTGLSQVEWDKSKAFTEETGVASWS